MKAPMILGVVFIFFFGIGVWMLASGIHCAIQSVAAENWPTTLATVSGASLKSKRGGKGGTRYEVDLLYSYTVDGRHYEGNTLAFGYEASNDQDSHQVILDKLKSGETVVVHYDPLDPANATLSAGLHQAVVGQIGFAAAWLLFISGIVLTLWISAAYKSALLDHIILR